MRRRRIAYVGLGMALAIAELSWSGVGAAEEPAAKHAFSAKDWAAVRDAMAAAVSPDGTILYLVAFGGDRGPEKLEWWTTVDGSHATKLDLPEDFSPMGFTRDGHGLYGAWKANKLRQLAIFPLKDGKAAGSRLIGQPFDDPKYFWGRLSATLDADGKPLPYNAGSSAGSNLGPTNPALVDQAKGRVDALHAADPSNAAPIPIDLVTASASGLDPDISPAAAEYQVARVARARGLDEARVRALVASETEGRTLAVIGEPRVNVLALNLALDAAK